MWNMFTMEGSQVRDPEKNRPNYGPKRMELPEIGPISACSKPETSIDQYITNILILSACSKSETSIDQL